MAVCLNALAIARKPTLLVKGNQELFEENWGFILTKRSEILRKSVAIQLVTMKLNE